MQGTETLSRNSVFAHLGIDALVRIAARSIRQSFENGTWITRQGDIWPYLFLVEKGSVKAVMESFEGRSLILATFNPSDIFWGLALFHEQAPMPAGLCAAAESVLRLWPRDKILPIIMEDGKLSWELSRVMIQRAQLASEFVEKLAFQPVASRLARLLLEQTDEAGCEALHRDLTLDDMAARIGSTREVVSRFLHRFYNEGIINITRTEFSVMDRQKLTDLAQKVKG